jgi:hypothetical protein
MKQRPAQAAAHRIQSARTGLALLAPCDGRDRLD